ncbi:hypothetical protein D6C84_06467 [Aureobasidium pullulans]|uniref:Rho-GTPase-activating protein 8 n=1 Tax=Aureobasidium pullulans TaxID=5580 RepID=A0A4V4L0L3_AURPU|nr:hypothetical protein D6C84_06467 [Aureobasidium pullulans]
MTSFANSFWSSDQSYAGGMLVQPVCLGVLFGKLQQGVQENQQVLTIARMRAEAEDLYGQRLGDIDAATMKVEGGFQKDDGASVKKAFEGMRSEMSEAAKNHRKIASNIRELVVSPFARWCDAHAARVQNSQDDLQARIKAHDRQADHVRTYRSQYYNKCRRVEDLDEEEKLAFQDPQSEAAQSPKPASQIPVVKLSEPEEEDEPEPIDIGDVTYTPEQVKKILNHMLETIKLGEAKVPILGTYHNVSTGADITDYIQKHMNGTSVSYAERIGQDMVGHGFLRLVGNVGSTFANSSRMNYQWRPKVFQITGLPERRGMGRSATVSSVSSIPDSPVGAVGELFSGWNPLSNAHPGETPAAKLRREAREADERYKGAVRKLDTLRCNLEEAMVDHLKFMERCELDRLKAIKSVILDFSGAISNVIPSLQSTVDNMMLFQETVQPLGDLRYLLENYRTGPFVPKVTIYENYYNNVDEQTFGIDIEARARADRKRVPLIVTTLLTFLDNHYPELEGDEARRSIWLVDVPLAATHHLRNILNTGKDTVSQDTLDRYEIPIVASVLKLYLLELPDSLVSAHVYEIIKTIYTSTAPNTSEGARISVIQSTLGQLRLANIATLDAITTHFTRLIELTSAEEGYISALSTTLAPCILRPKQGNTLSLNEKFNYRLVRDLFAHKDTIFGELKRQSSLTHTNSGASRPRAISTDESRRREHMEERQRAIIAAAETRGRASSPFKSTFGGPLGSMHKRERSTGAAETRFPVTPSAASTPTDARNLNRGSLEVPSSPTRAPVLLQSPPKGNGRTDSLPSSSDSAAAGDFAAPVTRQRSDTTNSVIMTPGAQTEAPDYLAHSQEQQQEEDAGSEAESAAHESNSAIPASRQSVEVEKRNSLNRSMGRVARKGTASSLSRHSLIGKRESVGSVGTSSSGAAAAPSTDFVDSPVDVAERAEEEALAHRGVELVDKPMDDD